MAAATAPCSPSTSRLSSPTNTASSASGFSDPMLVRSEFQNRTNGFMPGPPPCLRSSAEWGDFLNPAQGRTLRMPTRRHEDPEAFPLRGAGRRRRRVLPVSGVEGGGGAHAAHGGGVQRDRDPRGALRESQEVRGTYLHHQLARGLREAHAQRGGAGGVVEVLSPRSRKPAAD